MRLRLFWHRLSRFSRDLFEGSGFVLGRVEDSPETVVETGRRRGVRGF